MRSFFKDPTYLRKFEYALIAFVLFGMVWRFLDFPFSNIVLNISLSSYIVFSYILIRTLSSKQEIQQVKMGLHLLSFMGAGLMMGILFTLVTYPNAFIILSVGLIGCSLGLLLLFTGIKNNPKEIPLEVRFQFKKMLVITFVGGAVLLLPKYFFFKLEHRNDPKLIELFIQMEEDRTDENVAAFRTYQEQSKQNP